MKTKNLLALVLFSIVLVNCAKKSSTPAAAVDNSSQIPGFPTELAKTVVRCDTNGPSAGTVMNGKTNSTSMTLAANGTYSMYTVYTEGTGCVLNKLSDGHKDVFDFFQQGTFTIDATLGDGSYQISFMPVVQYVVGRNDGPLGDPMRVAVNGNCSPSPNIPAGSGSQVSVLGITCGSGFDSNYVIPSTPLIGTAIKQIIKPNGATWAVGARDDFFHLGQGSYPGSTSETWYVYP